MIVLDNKIKVNMIDKEQLQVLGTYLHFSKNRETNTYDYINRSSGSNKKHSTQHSSMCWD